MIQIHSRMVNATNFWYFIDYSKINIFIIINSNIVLFIDCSQRRKIVKTAGMDMG